MAKDMLRERLAKYIPPRDQWTPVDEALYGVEDIYNVPDDKAKKLREDAIRYSFKHHYEGNRFYHNYCKKAGVGPDDIKTEEDFGKIPLVPDTFFKSYPDIEEDRGKDFIEWLKMIYTGELPKIELKKKPSYDDVIEELAKKNIWLCFSTSTSGRFSFVPRDYVTYCRFNFSIGHALVKSIFPPYNPETFEPFTAKELGVIAFTPNPSKTRHSTMFGEPVFCEVLKDHDKIYLTDMNLTTDIMRILLGKPKGIKQKTMAMLAPYSEKAFVSKCIKYLKKWEKEGKGQLLVGGFPASMLSLISTMEEKEIKFDFDGCFFTSGGWKNLENNSISPEEFRKKVKDRFGILEEYCRDGYMMTEMNIFFPECKSHYKHIPYFSYATVLDEEMNSLAYGESGRFAFLDPLSNSYPGFIITGDRVKLLEHCPECDRPGAVLAPEISRLESAEPKGCAEVSAKLLEEMGG
jgi:hypothetical protein